MINKILCACVIFGSLTLHLTAGEPNKDLEIKCMRPTIAVNNKTDGSAGSGTIIRSIKNDNGEWVNIVLTCKHVTDEMDSPQVVMYKFKEWSSMESSIFFYEATIIAEHPDYDIALVGFLSSEKMPVAELGFDEKIFIGNDLFSFSCGNKSMPRLEKGYLTGIYNENRWLRSHLVAIPGDSGGGVYHNNKLIAIIIQHGVSQMDGKPEPVFSITNDLNVICLKEWSEKNEIADIYNPKSAIPKLPFIMMKARLFSLTKEPELNLFQSLDNVQKPQ